MTPKHNTPTTFIALYLPSRGRCYWMKGRSLYRLRYAIKKFLDLQRMPPNAKEATPSTVVPAGGWFELDGSGQCLGRKLPVYDETPNRDDFRQEIVEAIVAEANKKEKEDDVTRSPEPQPKNGGNRVAEAIIDLVEGKTGGVDEAAVTKIATKVAKKEIADQFKPPVTVRVEQVDKPAIEIENAHPVMAEVMECLQVDNVLLVGPSGSGKTTLAGQIAEALDLPFHFNGAILAKHEVTGFVDAGGNYHSTPFRTAFENGGVYLFDELDSSSEQALLAFNAALANGFAEFPDTTKKVERHEDFRCLAAANTWGHGADRQYVGRNQLDAATLNRFIPIPMDYSDSVEATLGASRPEWLRLVRRVRSKVRELKLRHVISTREVVRGVALLDGGMGFDRAAEIVLRRDLSAKDWGRVS